MGEKINVLFLDHDGVICLPDQWGKRNKGSSEIENYFDKFDKKAIKILNEIIEKTDCEIVVSSDWRFHCKIDQMQELYLKRGILKSLKTVNYPFFFPCDLNVRKNECKHEECWKLVYQQCLSAVPDE